jgi:hypothetical protein
MLIRWRVRGFRTPGIVQELMCGQRQAPVLRLSSRRGGNRRVVECLPEIVEGGVYGGAGRGERSDVRAKALSIIEHLERDGPLMYP